MMDPYTLDQPPLDSIDWEQHVSLIGRANRALAWYDGVLLGIVNPQILLSPLATHEAVLSSRIEGTQASLEDVLQHEADVGLWIIIPGFMIHDKSRPDACDFSRERKAVNATTFIFP